MVAFVFLLSFCAMEFAAWAVHKYLMHGALWWLHEDHHVPNHKTFQKNDSFAFIFALPSFFSILFGNMFALPLLTAAGYGIMAYGAAYFLVHEAIIHRRFRFLRGRGAYFRGLIVAHREHHRNQGKEGSRNFGMLIVHPKYFAPEAKVQTGS